LPIDWQAVAQDPFTSEAYGLAPSMIICMISVTQTLNFVPQVLTLDTNNKNVTFGVQINSLFMILKLDAI